MQKTEFFLVRHGETDWNKQVRIQGHTDIPLNDIGIAQAEALAKTINRYTFDVIYSSDLIRAQRTAQVLANALGMPIQLDAGLREKNLGILQGLTRSEAEAQHPEVFARYFSADADYQLPEGESTRQFYQRSLDTLQALALKHPGQRLLVVSHGGFLSNVFRAAVGLPLELPRLFKVLNTSLNHFSFDERWHLESWGDVAHLRDADALDDF